MRRIFALMLVFVMAFAVVNASAQTVSKQNKLANMSSSEKALLARLQGLSEEQILALLKTLSVDDIMTYLNVVVEGGTRELLVNMIGALNTYISTMPAQEANEVAQRAASENNELSYGTNKTGTPVVYVTVVNETMNNAVHTSATTQSEIINDRPVVSGGGTL